MKIEIEESKLNKLWELALWYSNRGGIAGQAFTNYVCLMCDRDCLHENTNTPIICRDCQKEVRAKRKDSAL